MKHGDSTPSVEQLLAGAVDFMQRNNITAQNFGGMTAKGVLVEGFRFALRHLDLGAVTFANGKIAPSTAEEKERRSRVRGFVGSVVLPVMNAGAQSYETYDSLFDDPRFDVLAEEI